MKLKDKDQTQDVKTGRFASKLDDTIIVEIIKMVNDAWMIGDIINDLMSRFKVSEKTAVKWFMYSQRIEMYMRKGLDLAASKLAVDNPLPR